MKLLLPSAAVVFLVAATTLALRGEDRLAERFRGYDRDNDGRVSMDELSEAPQLRRLDLNGDGSITLDEAREGMKKARPGTANSAEGGQPLELVFKHFDQNADNTLSREELPDAQGFAKLDANKDGSVTLDEARAVFGSVVPRQYVPAADSTPPVAKPDDSLKEQPQMLKPGEHGVGHLVPDITLKNSKGEPMTLSANKRGRGLVLALFSANCPISNKLGPELARIQTLCATNDIGFAMVNTVEDEKPEDVEKFTSTHQLNAPVLHDADQSLLCALAATTTTEVFLLDAARTLVYRGAVNDQYGLGYAKDSPKENHLRDAISSLLAGEVIQVAATTAPGCALDLPKAGGTVTKTDVTYHHQVSRIVQNHCVECHRQDGLGPFSLESMADVIENAGMIKKQVARGAMPPWFAAKEEGAAESPWKNDCSLSAQDKADLLAWLDSDRPAGDAKDAPLPRKFTGSWSIGTPDAVFQLPKPFAIKAEGTMPYQHAVVETSFPEDRWVQAYEIMPTAPTVVHHVIVRVHKKGIKVDRNNDEGREGYWAAYVPGNTHRAMPDGFAKRLPAGATISFQIHYTPKGKAVEDQLKIGLRFAKEPPHTEVRVAAVAHPKINIPAGAADHLEVRQQGIPMDMLFSAFMAHMHVRGKAFKYEVTYPDGKSEVLLDIPRYDFNWQLAYDYRQPKFIPRGSVLKISAVFDNSTGNPANPDPAKNVRWGSQTYDEMMIGYIEHYVPVAPPKVAAK